MEDMDLELGSLLKKERENKGLTIEDIQNKTKIRKKYIKAIEKNNFEELPGKVYLKIFVKGIAREVDVDYQMLLNNYEVFNIQENKKSNLNKNYLEPEKISTSKNTFSPNNFFKKIFKIVSIILLILFLGAALVYTYQYITDSDLRLLPENTTIKEEKKENTKIINENETKINEKNPVDSKNEKEENNANKISTNVITNDLDLNSLDLEKNIELNNLMEELNADFEDGHIIIDQKQSEKNPTIQTKESKNNELKNTETTNININDLDDQDLQLDNEKTNKNEKLENNKTENKTEETPDGNLFLNNNLYIKADDTVWITVNVDEDQAFSGILEKGDQREFQPKDTLYIKMGVGNVVTAQIAGKTYGPWGESAKIVELEFTSEKNELKVNNLRD